MLAARLIRDVPLFRIFHSLNAEIESAEISLVRSGHYVQTASAGLRRRGLRPFAPLGLKPQPPMIYQSWVIITAVRRTKGRRGNAPVPPTTLSSSAIQDLLTTLSEECCMPPQASGIMMKTVLILQKKTPLPLYSRGVCALFYTISPHTRFANSTGSSTDIPSMRSACE